MPNSCISITKIILICSLVFLTSCSSVSESTFSEKRFVGKFKLTQHQTSSNLTVRIKVFPENIIIQIGKPLFGNLMKIKFNHSMGLSFDSKVDSKYLSLFQNFKKQDYLFFFNSCFNNLDSTQNIFFLNKHGIELKCEYISKNTFSVYFKAVDNLYISGALMRE